MLIKMNKISELTGMDYISPIWHNFLLVFFFIFPSLPFLFDLLIYFHLSLRHLESFMHVIYALLKAVFQTMCCMCYIYLPLHLCIARDCIICPAVTVSSVCLSVINFLFIKKEKLNMSIPNICEFKKMYIFLESNISLR